jgi:hypothetical protein
MRTNANSNANTTPPTTMTIGHARVGQIQQGKPISTVWASLTDFDSTGQVRQHRPNSTARPKFNSAPGQVQQHGPSSAAQAKFDSATQVRQCKLNSTTQPEFDSAAQVRQCRPSSTAWRKEVRPRHHQHLAGVCDGK